MTTSLSREYDDVPAREDTDSGAPGPAAWAEIVLALSGLGGDCGPALVRVLGQLRVHRLTAGARVEVHEGPPALTAELGARPATAYTVWDAPTPG